MRLTAKFLAKATPKRGPVALLDRPRFDLRELELIADVHDDVPVRRTLRFAVDTHAGFDPELGRNPVEYLDHIGCANAPSVFKRFTRDPEDSLQEVQILEFKTGAC